MSLTGTVVTERAVTHSRRRSLGIIVLPYVLIAPTVLGVLVFSIVPVLVAVRDSFYLANQAVRVPVFAGFANYVEAFDDEVFRTVLRVTSLFVLWTVPVSIALALALALALNRRIRGLAILRGAFFHPTAMPAIGAATIWLFMYTPGFGLVNELTSAIGLGRPNWLGTPELALPAFIAVAVWKQSGYLMLFYLAGLQGIGRDLYEAAELDGASGWQAFRSLMLPLLSGTTLFVVTIAVASAFQFVDPLYVMTQGGPNDATRLWLYHIWETAFRFRDRGQASALTTMFLIVTLAFTVTNFVVADRRSHYDD